MAVEVIMPALGMAQDTGIILAWLKSEGDAVERGEPLMEVETDKATVEIEAPATGTLARILAGEGAEVPVGQVVALIAGPGEEVDASLPGLHTSSQSGTAEKTTTAKGKKVRVSPVAKRLAETSGVNLDEVPAHDGRITKEDVTSFLEARQKAKSDSGRFLASPKARRLMEEMHISPDEVKGSGPDGAILVADVLAVAERKRSAFPTSPARVGERSKPESVQTANALSVSKVWRIMADRTARSWRGTPHFYLTREVDVSRFVGWREELAARSDVRVTFSDLLVKVVATALRRFPRMNVVWQDGKLLQQEEIAVGLAVATEDGLMVPVVRGADRAGVTEIAVARAELVDRAREHRLRPEEIGGASLTISNLGMYGVDSFSAIINSPEPAILAVGRIRDEVVAVAGEVTVRPTMTVTLSCDHRAIDGAQGARFLQVVVEMIEDPLRVLD